jgi:hypothetical protein
MKKFFTVHHLGFSWNGMIMARFTICMLNWEHHLVLSLGFWTLVYSVFSCGIFGNVFYQLSAVWDLFSNGLFFWSWWGNYSWQNKFVISLCGDRFCGGSFVNSRTVQRPDPHCWFCSYQWRYASCMMLACYLHCLKEIVLLKRELNLTYSFCSKFLFPVSLWAIIARSW